MLSLGDLWQNSLLPKALNLNVLQSDQCIMNELCENNMKNSRRKIKYEHGLKGYNIKHILSQYKHYDRKYIEFMTVLTWLISSQESITAMKWDTCGAICNLIIEVMKKNYILPISYGQSCCNKKKNTVWLFFMAFTIGEKI